MFDSLAKEAIFSVRPALLSPGFPDASDPTGNIEHFGLIGGWGASATAPLPEKLPGLIGCTLRTTTVFFRAQCTW